MQGRQEEILGTERIPRLMIRLAIPSIVAQMINILYNIVDRMYIGRIAGAGDLALTGLGVTFPILMIISAFSAFAGMGGAPLASIELGKGDRQQAEKILGNATSMLLIFSVVLTAVFLVFKEPLLFIFGASVDTFPYADQYLTIYLMGTIFVQLALGLNMFISSQGKAKIAMISVLIGALINIVLDPILIYGLNMGVRGAAIATVISQAVSAAWVVGFLASKKTAIRIRLKNMTLNWRLIGGIAALGVSPFIMQATESAVIMVLNSGLQAYGGDMYVGSMTILQSTMQLVIVPIQGFAQGIQPIISYNYGAKQYDRVKKTCGISFVICFVAATVCCLTCVLFPGLFASIFTPKAELIDLVMRVMPIYMGGMWMFGIQMSCQTAFIGLGQAKRSLLIALLRKVILLIPLALILPGFLGVMGIYWAEPIADILSATVAGLIFLFSYKKILSDPETLSA